MNESVINIFNSASNNFCDIWGIDSRASILISRYRTLKNRFEAFITQESDQFTYFTWFYGMRYCSHTYRSEFYRLLKSYRINGLPADITPSLLAERLEQYGRYEFVFATKMLSLLNESLYPIADRKIAKMFQFDGTYRGSGEELLADIRETYDFLSTSRCFVEFVNIHQCTDLSNYRVLDIMLLTLSSYLNRPR